MKKQQDEIMAIMKMREAASSGKQVGPPGRGDLPGAPALRGDLTSCCGMSRRCPRQGPSVPGWGDQLQVEVLSRCPSASRGLHLHCLPGGEEDGGRAARQGEWWGGGRRGDGDPPVECPNLCGVALS